MDFCIDAFYSILDGVIGFRNRLPRILCNKYIQ